MNWTKETEKDIDSFSTGEISRVLSALANEEAIKIFFLAENGIKCSTEAIKKLGLTQKQYYSRLKALLEAHLIQKQGNCYQYTALGSICFRLGEVLADVVSHYEKLELMDKVSRSTSFSIKEKEEVISAVSKTTMANFADLLNGGIKPVGIVSCYEDIIAGVKRLIDNATKEVYLATRYTDASITQTILNCLNREVEMYLLDGDKKNLSQKIQLIRLILFHPKMVRQFYEIFRSPKVHTGYVDNLPYSFIVVDRKYVGIEIPRPESDDFFIGLFFENKLLSEKLIEIFVSLRSKAKEDPKKELSEKFMLMFPTKY